MRILKKFEWFIFLSFSNSSIEPVCNEIFEALKFFTLKFHSSSVTKYMWCSYSFWQRWRYVINYTSSSFLILCNWNLHCFLKVVLTLIQKSEHFIRYDLVEQFTSNTVCFIFRYYHHKKKAYSSKTHGKLIERNYTDNNEDAIKTLHAAAHVSKLARKVGRVSRVPAEKQLSLFRGESLGSRKIRYGFL